MNRVLRIKVDNDDLEETVRIWSEAYKFCLKKGIELKTYSKKKLHDSTYYELRKKYPRLQSSLVQTARNCACDSLKQLRLRKNPKLKSRFVRYNARTFSFKNGIVSISTVNGRMRIPIKIPDFFGKYSDWKCESAVLSEKDCQLWLNMNFKKDSEMKIPKRVLGIDRGINNIAVCSNGSFYNSKHLKDVKSRYQYLKKVLQSKGTRSAKRKLKKMVGKEKRFVKDVNHCISKDIASKPYTCFALENLKNIPRDKGRRFNKKLGNWSFFQLEFFLRYKAEELGKTIIKVNPRYTSQMCSRCGNIKKGNRKGNIFRCGKCGFDINADLNASRNIAKLGISELGRLQVNQPNVATNVSYKPPFLNGGS